MKELFFIFILFDLTKMYPYCSELALCAKSQPPSYVTTSPQVTRENGRAGRGLAEVRKSPSLQKTSTSAQLCSEWETAAVGQAKF